MTFIGTTGGIGTLSFSASAGCAWTISANVPWISFQGPTSGTDTNGSILSIAFSAAASNGAARQGIINISGQVLTVYQTTNTPCTFTLGASNAHFPATGGTGTISMTTTFGCEWSASSAVQWVGLGNDGPFYYYNSGSQSYTVYPNLGPARSYTLYLGNLAYTITQDSGQIPGVLGSPYSLQTIASAAPLNGIPGLSANIGSIGGLAVDALGNVYMSLSSLDVIVKMDTTGMLSVIAGNFRRGFSGDGGPATQAQLSNPTGLAFDSAGSLYIADYQNDRIRKVSNGVITTVAGSNIDGGDGDLATNAFLGEPNGIAFDRQGNMYIAEYSRIRKVTNGVITTIAGNGIAGYSGDGGPATQAQIYGPTDVALDSAGNVYIADFANGRVRKVSNGIITTYEGGPGYYNVSRIFFDKSDTMYIVEYLAASVKTFSAGVYTPIAGSSGGQYGFVDGVLATNALLFFPSAAALDPMGNLYIADSGNFCLRKVSGGIINVVAGLGAAGDGGPSLQAQLASPSNIATDSSGNVYIIDNDRIREIQSGVISTVAGTGVPGPTGDGGPATQARISYAGAMAIDGSGNLFFIDNASIREVTSGAIITIAGTSSNPGYNGDNIPAISALFSNPTALAFDNAANLYVADSGNQRIRKIAAGIVTTVVGAGAAGVPGDGVAATRALINPHGLAIAPDGTIYFSDGLQIRKASNGVVTTVAGSGNYVFCCDVGDGGPALQASFAYPTTLALNSAGDIFVADATRVREISHGIITSVAGGDGPVIGNGFTSAIDIALSPTGDLYVADTALHQVELLACQFAVAPTLTFPDTGAQYALSIQAPSGCQWNVSGLPAWITASALTGSGPGTVGLTVTPNADVVRNATLSINGAFSSTSVVINQIASGCQFALAAGGEGFNAAGGTGSVAMTADAGCTWSLSGAPAWVTITAGTSGNGNGLVSFSIAANTGASRVATLTIGGQPFEIEQEASGNAGLALIGSIPHLAAQGGWTTTFTLVNKAFAASSSAEIRTNFYGTDGSALQLPLNLPEQPAITGPVLASSLDRIVPPNGLFVMQAEGPLTGPYVEGSGQIVANGVADGFAIFHFNPNNQEAVVPLETRNAASYLLPFDNTNGVLTGVALDNVSGSGAAIPFVMRNDAGTVILTGLLPGALTASSPSTLNAFGHVSFVLSQVFPQTANLRGTIELDTPAGVRISALGIRYTPSGTLTTIPALANVASGVGSMAHLAVNAGWQTTFVLVNTGSTPASATLQFFDDNGKPLALPLSFPQGSNAAQTTATLTQTVPANASLWVQSAGPAPGSGSPQTGSAQLTTTGKVSGYEVFRYNTNGQEAAVPIETRNAASYMVAFDNTSGVATGIAIANASGQALAVPVTLRDQNGTLLTTSSIPLNANGHTSFVLSSEFPGTQGLMGTAEFDAPAGSTISVVGIRTPPALTFTTLPPLAK